MPGKRFCEAVKISRSRVRPPAYHRRLQAAIIEKSEIKNAQIINGDGRLGLPSKSPFDRIIITAACKEVPKTLLDQLAIDGMLIAPVGENIQSLILLRKTTKGIVEVKNQEGYVFVPLV